jgi:hypothetical protein
VQASRISSTVTRLSLLQSPVHERGPSCTANTLPPSVPAYRSAGEPFTIYNGKGTPPADPVKASTTQTSIDITFGDENVGSVATPTPAPSPNASPVPTPTPTPVPCVGDCNGDGQVTVDEILAMVNVALGNASASACNASDANGDGQITIDEILTAVNHALNGCQG